jgi:hypothetical protein
MMDDEKLKTILAVPGVVFGLILFCRCLPSKIIQSIRSSSKTYRKDLQGIKRGSPPSSPTKTPVKLTFYTQYKNILINKVRL